ncbi:general transcription factor II-I repeat domain-containing protein 2A [Trichonephila clavipes]|nr:general transcription factor II-I repeat domain-containing protein 2A [Trichonephila clavipes]
MKDRILKLAENVTDQLKNDINSAPFISLCLDESIDITKSARLAVFARYCVGNIIKEELIAITSLLITTKGTDIRTAVRNSLAEKEIDLKRIVSVTTNDAPNMLKAHFSIVREVYFNSMKNFKHVHKTDFEKRYIENNQFNIVSIEKERGFQLPLNKRKFDALLDEVNLVYNGLIMYNNVRCLSRGNVLQRFVDCLEEIRLFLQNESKIEQYPQLMDIMWLLKLMFFTDICQHFNELNIKLQGPNKTVIVTMDLIRVFEAKLYVFRNDIITKKLQVLPKLEKKNIKDLDAQEKRNEKKKLSMPLFL